MTLAPQEPAVELRFLRADRILRRSEYLRVQQTGRRVHTAHFVILVLAGDRRRLGVTVGKRLGTAVRRNRVKRVVREVFRINRALLPADCDVVFVARQGAEHLDYGAVLAEIAAAGSALTRAAEASRKPRPTK